LKFVVGWFVELGKVPVSGFPPKRLYRDWYYALITSARGRRWRIERDYQKLKQELGFGHYEGRNWRGFHHHASLCIAAYGFLIAERCLFPLSSASSAGGSKHLRYPQASAPGCRRCGLSGLCRTRLPPSAVSSLSGWSPRCPGTRAVCDNSVNQ
jgi:hypothetical protein